MHIPTLNAALNGTSALFLAFGFWAIKNGHVQIHKAAMRTAFTTSVVFLVSYLYYHAQAGTTRFQGSGYIRSLYFAILISHTILAVVIVPLVIRTLYLAFKERFEDHRRWARWTWPIWMYVSLTGVVVYWMLYRLPV